MIIYPNAGAILLGTTIRTLLAGSKIRLYKDGAGIVLSRALTLAELEAAEADYTGYTEATITNFQLPLLNPNGGASIDSGVQQFAIESPYTDPNVIKGGWIETAAGSLLAVWDYAEPKSLVGAGDGFPVDVLLLFG